MVLWLEVERRLGNSRRALVHDHESYIRNNKLKNIFFEAKFDTQESVGGDEAAFQSRLGKNGFGILEDGPRSSFFVQSTVAFSSFPLLPSLRRVLTCGMGDPKCTIVSLTNTRT